jgi:hypothetical protein
MKMGPCRSPYLLASDFCAAATAIRAVARCSAALGALPALGEASTAQVMDWTHPRGRRFSLAARRALDAIADRIGRATTPGTP